MDELYADDLARDVAVDEPQIDADCTDGSDRDLVSVDERSRLTLEEKSRLTLDERSRLPLMVETPCRQETFYTGDSCPCL